MRTHLVVGVVVAAHCLAVGSVFLIQGCGTMMGTQDDGSVEPVSMVMPPSAEGDPQPATVLVPPAPRDDGAAAADAVSTEMVTYVVKKGDSLSSIAVKHGLSVAQVATLNGIRNPNLIRSGQRLLLPSQGASQRAAVEPGRPEPAKASARSRGGYVVKKGDSLSRIAFENGTSVKALKEANGLSGDVIMAGQELVIPGGVTSRKAPRPATQLKPPPVMEPDIKIDARAPAVDTRVDEPEVPKEVRTAPRASAPMRTRIVQEGEDLKTIAQQWGLSADELRRINNLGDGPVEPGQVLKIPLGDF